ncbi:MAG: hypothetical protein ACPGYX_05485 [Oceanobacter sp.]
MKTVRADAHQFIKSTLGVGVLVLSIAGLSSCGGGGGSSSGSGDSATLSISVSASNYYTGENLSDGEVTGAWLLADGSYAYSTAVANSDGEATLVGSGFSSAQRVVVTFDSDGFGEQSEVLVAPVEGDEVALELLPSMLETTVDASVANDLVVDGSTTALVSIPASALVDADGNTVTGEVSAEVTILDPSSDASVMPGGYQTSLSDDENLLESFGAVNVTFTDTSGNSLNLAEGQTATVRIPVAAGASTSASSMPLYYFDEALGYWVEEGIATLTYTEDGYFYVGEVSHFSTWNADQIYNTAYLSGCVEDQEGNPVAGARLLAEGQTYVGSSSATSGSDGTFEIAAQQSSGFLLTASNDDLYSVTVQYIYTEDRALTDCLVLEPAPATITLTWGQNPSDLDTRFGGMSTDGSESFHIYYSNKTATFEDATLALDVDDTSSFGPEVVTITSFPFAGSYEYGVHHYSGSSDIQASPARVELKLDDQEYVFQPPEGEATRCWSVFRLDVDEAMNVSVTTTGTWVDASACYAMGQSSVTASGFSAMAIAPQPTLVEKAVEAKFYSKSE